MQLPLFRHFFRLGGTCAVAVLVAGCAASERDASAGQEGAGIPIQPTPAGILPSAVLGTAPAPQGMHVQYFAQDSAARGYLAIPDGEGPFPALVLIHEWNGLVDRIRQMADAFAAEGYVALAADLYSGRTGSTREENMALVGETREDPDRVIANLDAAARFLRERADVTGKVAAMGWCFGGGVALSYALGGENHEGTAIFYGSLIEDPERLATIQHEVYGTFAALDQGIPPDQVERFVEALRSVGVANDVHIYDDVNHGFWLRVDQEQELREAPALDAWERLKAYLQRVLAD